MNSPIVELFTHPIMANDTDWQTLIETQPCAYLGRKCIKIRKSQPEIAIGTCSILHGVRQAQPIIICPHRFLERGQVFTDCLHLLTAHEAGNEIHRVAEVEIPGGNVDYFLVSVRQNEIVDFVGIEFQALDTTGTLWPARQQFLTAMGVIPADTLPSGTYGINWKMTAKTTMVQLHHKVETFEALGKHLVLVLQDSLLDYMRRAFSFDHVQGVSAAHTMHFHAYALQQVENEYRLTLASQFSTDAAGISTALGLQGGAALDLDVIKARLRSKLSPTTRFGF